MWSALSIRARVGRGGVSLFHDRYRSSIKASILYIGHSMTAERPNEYSLRYAEYGLRVGVWRICSKS